MNDRRNILRNFKSLRKFKLFTPRQFYCINHLTSYCTMSKLIDLAHKTKKFIVQTKSYHKNNYPTLIQILFRHGLKIRIVFIETLYLSPVEWPLRDEIRALFSVIFSPSNTIQSWTDIKQELHCFEETQLFDFDQVENLRVINIHDKFLDWFRKNCSDITLNYIPRNDWRLETAIAFMFQMYLDTTLSKSCDWNMALFLHIDQDHHEPLSYHNSNIISVPQTNQYREIHMEYVIHECVAVEEIAAALENSLTRKHIEEYLKTYYNVHHD